MSPLTGLTTKDSALLGGSPLRLECFGVVACRSLRSKVNFVVNVSGLIPVNLSGIDLKLICVFSALAISI